MTARSIIPTLVLWLAAAPFVLSQDEETPLVPLERIVENPIAFQDMKVSFVIQYHQPGKLDSPFRTQFERDWYMNFSGWPDGAPLWEKETYRQTFAHLFIPRRHAASRALLVAPKFSRWLLTGRIGSSYQGVPWIDITDVRRLETELTTESHRQLVSGFEYARQGRHQEAALAFRMADSDVLPKDIRTIAMRAEADALAQSGDRAGAKARFEDALKVMPNEPATLLAMKRFEAGAPRPVVATPTFNTETRVAENAPVHRPIPTEQARPRPVTTPRAEPVPHVEVVTSPTPPAPKSDGIVPPIVDNNPRQRDTVQQVGTLIPPLKKITLDIKPSQEPVTEPGGGN